MKDRRIELCERFEGKRKRRAKAARRQREYYARNREKVNLRWSVAYNRDAEKFREARRQRWLRDKEKPGFLRKKAEYEREYMARVRSDFDEYEKYLERMREYSGKYKVKNPDWRRRSYERNREKEIAADKERYRRWPEKHKARALARAAAAQGQGDLFRAVPVWGPCVFCGSRDRVELHHFDYSRPLDVIPVCRRCHAGEHARMRRERRKEERSREAVSETIEVFEAGQAGEAKGPV